MPRPAAYPKLRFGPSSMRTLAPPCLEVVVAGEWRVVSVAVAPATTSTPDASSFGFQKKSGGSRLGSKPISQGCAA